MDKIIRFGVGSIVSPTWNENAYGKVTEVKTENYRIVDWFQGDPLPCATVWKVDNLTYATSLKENRMYTLKCKPMSDTLEIEGGNWKYVAVNRHENKILAAFVNEMDAETYVQSYSGVFYIREVDNNT